MELHILLVATLAVIAGVQAFDVKRAPQINRVEHMSDDHTINSELEDPMHLVDNEPKIYLHEIPMIKGPVIITDTYPRDYIREVPVKQVKLGNTIDTSEPESESRVRRSPKDPATGKIVVQGGARKGSSTGGRTEGQVYVGGQIRFRRSLGDMPEHPEVSARVPGALSDEGAPKIMEQDHVEEEVHTETEQQTRFRRSPKKGRGRLIIRGEGGKGTGRKADVGVHLIGEYRF